MSLLIQQPRGADEHPLTPDVRRVIEACAAAAPRSAQVRLGASEYGIPCARRLAARLLNLPHLNNRDNWYPTIGTAVHTWLAAAFTAARPNRWLTDVKVEYPTPGTLDLYDLTTDTVLDFKIVGPTSLDSYARGGPGVQYRTQVQLYGDGMAALGLPVREVGMVFLGRCAPLSRMFTWTEPYDPRVGAAARERLAVITELALAVGVDEDPRRLQLIPSADAFCHACPWFSRTDPYGCPGHRTGAQ